MVGLYQASDCMPCHSCSACKMSQIIVITMHQDWCRVITSFDDKWQHATIDWYVIVLSKCLAKWVKGLPEQATQGNWHMASYLSTYDPPIHLQIYLPTHI